MFIDYYKLIAIELTFEKGIQLILFIKNERIKYNKQTQIKLSMYKTAYNKKSKQVLWLHVHELTRELFVSARKDNKMNLIRYQNVLITLTFHKVHKSMVRRKS